MPSDTLTPNPERTDVDAGAPAVDRILEALAPALDEFRSAVAGADEEVRAARNRLSEATADPADRLARELGPFAVGRIDATRLAALMTHVPAADPVAEGLMASAHQLFRAVMAGGRNAFHVRVPAGGDLRDAVRDALAGLGRAFGAAHAVEKVRERRYDPDRDHVLLHPYPFHRWSPLEKELAPPLVVEVEGRDLQAASLAEFLDGWQKLVLVVRGPAAPAPLARLVSPGVFVAQVGGDRPGAGDGVDVVAELSRQEGPGIVALFQADAGALPFVHRPGRALEVDRAALEAAVARAQERRGRPGLLDLRHLSSLVALPGVATPASPAPQARRTADQLAAWLLARTDLSDPEDP